MQREVPRVRFPNGRIVAEDAGCAGWIDQWAQKIARVMTEVIVLVPDWARGLEMEVDETWTNSCDASLRYLYRRQLVDALCTLGRAGVPLAISTAPYHGDGAHPSKPSDAEIDSFNQLYVGLRGDF